MTDRRDEAGFTVVEIAITMVISMCVMASLLGLLTSQTNADKRVQDTTNSQEAIRLAYVELVRDLRAAEPVLATPAPAAQQVAMDQPAQNGGTARRLEWVLESTPTGTALDRYELDPAGVRAPQLSYRLPGAVAGTQLFTFFGGAGTTPIADASTIPSCATRVHVVVAARTDGVGAPLKWETDIDLRNSRRPRFCK
jgi:type II secretory pathway pseudopilin PulG